MSNLPLISHHLFVSAIGHEGSADVTQAPANFSPPSQAVAVEVLDVTSEIPAPRKRKPLRSRARSRLGLG